MVAQSAHSSKVGQVDFVIYIPNDRLKIRKRILLDVQMFEAMRWTTCDYLTREQIKNVYKTACDWAE